MSLQRIQCTVCGSPLGQLQNGFYVCPCCRSTFSESDFEQKNNEVLQFLSESKQEELANARSNLYSVTHEKYLSRDRIKTAVTKVLSLYPEDVMGLFYQSYVNGKELYQTYLPSFDYQKNQMYVHSILDFIIANLDSDYEDSHVLCLKSFVENVCQGKEKYDFNTKIEAAGEKHHSGMYDLDSTWDVFLCYSSQDMIGVLEITEFLESHGLKCFVALRNLRHGVGALENYQANLFKAMSHSKSLVFVSSHQSRQMSCDALRVELPYLKDHLPNVARVEYLLEDYSSQENRFAQKLIQQTFAGLEWAKSKEDLLDRLSLTPKTEEKKVKFCIHCLTENPQSGKFCIKCGKGDFASSLEEATNEHTKNLKDSDITQCILGTSVKFGNYHGQSLSWKVLYNDGEKALLLSETIIDKIMYGQKKMFSACNNYAKSNIRQWLNNEFYPEAFNEEEQNRILSTLVDNSLASVNPHHSSACLNHGKNKFVCETTKDKVFLLSVSEVTDKRFGFEDSLDSSESRVLINPNGFGETWALRSPSSTQGDLIYVVGANGRINDNYGANFAREIRPAIYVKLKD